MEADLGVMIWAKCPIASAGYSSTIQYNSAIRPSVPNTIKSDNNKYCGRKSSPAGGRLSVALTRH